MWAWIMEANIMFSASSYFPSNNFTTALPAEEMAPAAIPHCIVTAGLKKSNRGSRRTGSLRCLLKALVLPQEQAVKGLLAKTKRFSPNPFNASILCAGIVQRDRFRVKEAVWYDRSYIRLFFGAFSEVGNHTVVQARAQNAFSTVIASFMWLSALPLLIFG